MSKRTIKNQPLKMLVDTCVWLHLAGDHRELPVIGAIEDLVADSVIELLVPEIVLTEFDRRKSHIIEETQRALQTHFRIVREAVNRFGDVHSKMGTLTALNEIDHSIAVKGDAAKASIGRIEKLLHSTAPLSTTDAIKHRVTERALAKKAPYHRDKNSAGDAAIIEIYAEQVSKASRSTKYALITHNTKDFSGPNGDKRKPHGDLAHLFHGASSTYWISIVDALKEIDPGLLADHTAEVNYSAQPRRLSEVLEAEYLLTRQVCYNRHHNLRHDIAEGIRHIVAEKDYSRNPYRPDQILDTIWEGVLASAKKTEEEVGVENLGPWDDFEWGMINGKLSAIRWFLGDEWDSLYT